MTIKATTLAAAIAATLGAAALAGCHRQADAANANAAPGADAAMRDLKLERVVMLMRHGVRPPTKPKVVPEGIADKPWPTWSVDFGELTQRGYDAVRLLSEWDRSSWTARGLLPATGCPGKDQVVVAASAKSRTQATARALVEGMVPGCTIDIEFPKTSEDDVEFHPIDAGAVPFDADVAFRETQDELPADGLQGEVKRKAELFALLNRAFGCKAGAAPDGKLAACDLSKIPPGIQREEGDSPSIGDPFGIASTASQTFLLEYLEGMPMEDVAWGRLSREDISRLLEFHTIKFLYEARTPYTAVRAASPLASRMLGAMEHGPKLTVLVGHDTNIANLGGFLDLHWSLPDYPDDDPPPGGALGFEVLADAAGKEYVRAFYRAQTMDQVRKLEKLTAANAPSYVYLQIPGCAEPCALQDFSKLVRAKLVEPLPRSKPPVAGEKASGK